MDGLCYPYTNKWGVLRMNNYQDVVSLTVNYLRSIGVSEEFISQRIINGSFDSAWVMKLPTVCIMKENRLEHSGSNQTHIHITGETMEFFFDRHEIDNLTSSTDDEYVDVELIDSNLVHLDAIKRANRNEQMEPAFQTNSDADIIESRTVKKLTYRQRQAPQVQLSKFRLDHSSFLRLRHGLFTGDLLVFFKRDNHDFLVIGIPFTHQRARRVHESSEVFFNRQRAQVVREEQVPVETNDTTGNRRAPVRHLRNVTSESIGTYTVEDNSSDNENTGNSVDEHDLFDLSEGISRRRQRTVRHHAIVRGIATLLESAGFSLYEDPVDCLAIRDIALIFEVKTLDGTSSDEMKQVRAAIGQLFYYEAFAVNDQANLATQKIALFETKISDEHIRFLEENHCLALWINEDNELDGSDESLAVINELFVI